MFCIKICLLEPEPIGAELLRVEPEPKFFTWSRSWKKNIWSRSRGKLARLRNTVSAHLPAKSWIRRSFKKRVGLRISFAQLFFSAEASIWGGTDCVVCRWSHGSESVFNFLPKSGGKNTGTDKMHGNCRKTECCSTGLITLSTFEQELDLI